MKGQVSVEFMSLLALTLLASSVLVTQVNERAVQFSDSKPYREAQLVAQKVSYTFDYVKAEGNTSKNLEFDSELIEEYDIQVSTNATTVSFDEGNVASLNRYEGIELNLKTSESYEVSYNNGYQVK